MCNILVMLAPWVSVPSVEVREMAPFGKGNQVHKFLRKAGFYLTSRNPPIVQVEPIFGYLDCLLKFGEMVFSLDLTVSLHRNYSGPSDQHLQPRGHLYL